MRTNEQGQSAEDAARRPKKVRVQITYGKATKPSGRDIVHPEIRKRLNPISKGLSRAMAVGNNADSLVRRVTGNKRALPVALKRTLNSPLGTVANTIGQGIEKIPGTKKTKWK